MDRSDTFVFGLIGTAVGALMVFATVGFMVAAADTKTTAQKIERLEKKVQRIELKLEAKEIGVR